MVLSHTQKLGAKDSGILVKDHTLRVLGDPNQEVLCDCSTSVLQTVDAFEVGKAEFFLQDKKFEREAAQEDMDGYVQLGAIVVCCVGLFFVLLGLYGYIGVCIKSKTLLIVVSGLFCLSVFLIRRCFFISRGG